MNAKQLRGLNVTIDLICDQVTPDDAQTFHYWRNFKDELDMAELRNCMTVRKEEIAAQFVEFAAQFGAQDVASSWGPMSGLTVEGIMFEVGRAVPKNKIWRYAGTMEVFFGEGRDGWMYKHDTGIKSKLSTEVGAKLKELQESVNGPTELSDFMLNQFGLHKAPGSSIDNGKRVILPPQIHTTPLGLFLRTPQERLYELSDNWERVPTSAFVFAQDVASMVRRQQAESETL